MKTKDYTAFISYSHDDAYWADVIQKKMERFCIPTALRQSRPDIPSTVRPVFKDDTDLTPGVLSQRINDALDRSSFLIVVCSASSAKSEWVNKEVEHFIARGKTSHIIPVVVGNPDGNADVRRFMPSALRNVAADEELVWIDALNEGMERTVVKIIAVILNVNFDSLWQRHIKESARSRRRRIVGRTLGAVIVVALAVFGIVQYTQLRRQKLNAEKEEVAARAMALVGEGETINALHLLTDDYCRLLDSYNGNIDRALRYAIGAYEQPGWTCIWTGKVDFSDVKSARDTMDVPMADNVLDACASPSGRLVAHRYAIDSNRAELSVSERATGKLLLNIDVPRPIMDVSFELANDSCLVLAVKGEVKVIDICSGRVLHEYVCSSTPFVEMLSDNLLGIYDPYDESCRVYDIAKGENLATLKSLPFKPVYARSDADGNRLCVAGEDGQARILRYNGPKKQLTRKEILALSPDGSRYAMLDSLDRIQVRATLTDSIVATLPAIDSQNPPLLGFAPGNKQIAVAGVNGYSLVDIGSGKTLSARTFDGKHPYAFSGDASTVFLFDDDNANYACNMAEGSLVPVRSEGLSFAWPGYDGSLYLCFGADDRRELEICRTGRDKPERTLRLDEEYIPYSVAVDPQGRYVAVLHTPASADATQLAVSVISLADGTTVARYSNPGYDTESYFRFTDNALALTSRAGKGEETLAMKPWHEYAALKGRALEILAANKGL